jgi:hypothetical protein
MLFDLFLAWLYNHFLFKCTPAVGQLKQEARVGYPPVEPHT